MNRLMRISVFLILFTNLFVLSVLGQESVFKQGVIFPNDGASISGYIKYDYKVSTSEVVEFRESEQGSVRQYTPADIKGFEFENNSFVSREALLDSAIGKGKVFEGLPKAQTDKRRVFLQRLVGGSKSLYVHTDDLGVTRFFIERDGEIELLNHGLYQSLNSRNEVVRQSINDFRFQLDSYLRNCSKASQLARKVNYNQKKLIAIFNAYSQCEGVEKLSFFNTAFRKKPEISLLAGMTLNDIEFSDGTNNQSSPAPVILELAYDPTPGFAFGVGLNLDLVKSGSLSIATSLLYTTFNSNGESTVAGPVVTQSASSSIKYTSLRFNFLPRFNIPFGKTKVFLQGGFSIGSLSVNEDILTIRTVSAASDTERTTRLVDPDQFFDTYAARVLGLGLTVRERFTFETRLELSGSLHGVRDIASDTKRYYFLLGYKL